MFAVRSALDMHCSLAQVAPTFLRYRRALTTAVLEPAYKTGTEGPIEDGRMWPWCRTIVMNERPEPDLDRVREAMRDHDARERDEREQYEREHDEREHDEDEREEQEDDEED
jgi:hypothetical protein